MLFIYFILLVSAIILLSKNLSSEIFSLLHSILIAKRIDSDKLLHPLLSLGTDVFPIITYKDILRVVLYDNQHFFLSTE